MKTRHFKIMEPLFGEGGAHLRFRGQWLCEAGFNPGQQIAVDQPHHGVLLLRVLPPSAAETQRQAALNQFALGL
jgi:hypothetical protein